MKVYIVAKAMGSVFIRNYLKMSLLFLKADQSSKKTQLGRVEKGVIRKLEYKKAAPYGVNPRNVGQYFLQEALMQSAEKAPLVIVKGWQEQAKRFILWR